MNEKKEARGNGLWASGNRLGARFDRGKYV